MDVIQQLILTAVEKWPVVSSILMVMGVLRACFKPLMGLLQSYVLATPSKSDDEFLKRVESGKIYQGFVWFIDYFASIKLPVTKASDASKTS